MGICISIGWGLKFTVSAMIWDMHVKHKQFFVESFAGNSDIKLYPCSQYLSYTLMIFLAKMYL